MLKSVTEIREQGKHPIDYYAESLGKLVKLFHRGLINEKEYKARVREVNNAMIEYHNSVVK